MLGAAEALNILSYSLIISSQQQIPDTAQYGSDYYTGGTGNTETFYRSMSQADYQKLLETGRIPATGETFISPSQAYSSGYGGVLVEFNVNAGTTSALQSIGVRDASSLTGTLYADMPGVSSGWTNYNAFFKAEGSVVNIGLGQGNALNTFNNNIVSFRAIGG